MTGELLAAAGCGAVVVAYLLHLVFGPGTAAHRHHRHTRLLWVRGVMAERGQAVMAVQSLRNYVMAASFKASSALLLAIGTVTLSAQADGLARAWQPAGGVPWAPKVLILLGTLAVAFVSFALTVRHLNHVLFLVGLNAADATGPRTPEHVSGQLNRAGICYTLGMRALLLAVPVAAWLAGPAALVVATATAVGLCVSLDRLPAPH